MKAAEVRSRRSVCLRSRGQNQVEFTATFTVLVLLVLLPLINFGAIPVRIGIAQAIVRECAGRLALAEKFSLAAKSLNDGSLNRRIAGMGGADVKSVSLGLRMSSVANKAKAFLSSKPGQMPGDWLPDGSNCPCAAELRLTVVTDVFPLVLMPGLGGTVPGLTGPIPVTFEESASWENLGRDPETGEFYLNE